VIQMMTSHSCFGTSKNNLRLKLHAEIFLRNGTMALQQWVHDKKLISIRFQIFDHDLEVLKSISWKEFLIALFVYNRDSFGRAKPKHDSPGGCALHRVLFSL